MASFRGEIKRRKVFRVAAVYALVAWLLGFCFLVTAQAHHSIIAHYDPGDVREITGTVISVRWANPHTQYVISVENQEGELETWRAEGGALNTLTRTGLTPDLFQPGSTITIIGPVSRFGRTEMIAAAAVAGGNQYALFPALANELDQELSVEPTITSAAGYEITLEEAPDLFRVWTPIDFPATAIRPQELPLTEAARVSMDAYDAIEDDLAAECTPAGMPSMLDQPYPVEFIDQGDRIVMRLEEWNGVRTIYMNGTAADEGRGTIYGHSMGHWEGAALVIETTGIDYPYYNDAGAPMTEDMLVTERYSISPDGRRMDWTATIVDPSVFTASVSLGGWAVWAPDIEIRDFNCIVE